MKLPLPASIRIAGLTLALTSFAYLFDNELPQKISTMSGLRENTIEIGFLIVLYGVILWSLILAIWSFRKQRRK